MQFDFLNLIYSGVYFNFSEVPQPRNVWEERLQQQVQIAKPANDKKATRQGGEASNANKGESGRGSRNEAEEMRRDRAGMKHQLDYEEVYYDDMDSSRGRGYAKGRGRREYVSSNHTRGGGSLSAVRGRGTRGIRSHVVAAPGQRRSMSSRYEQEVEYSGDVRSLDPEAYRSEKRRGGRDSRNNRGSGKLTNGHSSAGKDETTSETKENGDSEQKPVESTSEGQQSVIDAPSAPLETPNSDAVIAVETTKVIAEGGGSNTKENKSRGEKPPSNRNANRNRAPVNNFEQQQYYGRDVDARGGRVRTVFNSYARGRGK